MRSSANVAIALGVTLMLGACAPDGTVSNTAGGAVIGGASGAAVGALVGGRNRGTAALVGGLAGAVVGGAIGAQLDAQSEARRQAAYTALALQAERERNFASAQPVNWSNPQQGTSGRLRAKSRPVVVQGRRCMPVAELVTINGQVQEVEETRCQGADGKWS